MVEVTSLATRYKQLENKRSSVLERARECAKLTIPSLLPPDGSDEQTKLYKPFQSQGARGVNTLASKLMLTLLPPNSPFFRFTIDPSLIQEGSKSEDVEATLSQMESVLVNHIEGSGERVQIFQFLRLLIITGNALLYFPSDVKGASLKIYRLDQYVCQRDPLGNLLEFLIKEQIAPMAITDETIRNAVLAKTKQLENSKNYVELYTRVYLDKEKDKWITAQEVSGFSLPEADGEFEKDELPYLALRWSALPNENYGRSYVDEVIGDLRSLEGLSQARLEASSASAKVLFFVAPNGTTRSVDIANAENLEVLEGNAEDVSVLQVNKNADIATIRESVNDLKQDLAFHFMMNSSIQRQAERVTAEEIRTMASELEESLGGTYSVLSQEFQLPYIKLKIQKLRESGAFPEGSENIEPLITTGLEGLGRGQDYNKIITFMQTASTLAPQAASMLNYEYVLKSLATSLGIKDTDILLDADTIAQQQQQAQQQELMSKATPNLVSGISKAMTDPSVMQQMTQMQQGDING